MARSKNDWRLWIPNVYSKGLRIIRMKMRKNVAHNSDHFTKKCFSKLSYLEFIHMQHFDSSK